MRWRWWLWHGCDSGGGGGGSGGSDMPIMVVIWQWWWRGRNGGKNEDGKEKVGMRWRWWNGGSIGGRGDMEVVVEIVGWYYKWITICKIFYGTLWVENILTNKLSLKVDCKLFYID